MLRVRAERAAARVTAWERDVAESIQTFLIAGDVVEEDDEWRATS